MAQFNPEGKKLTSGFVVGGISAYIEAAKISTDTYGVAASWPSDEEFSANSGFVPTIGAVDSEIKSKISTVYKVRGTHTVKAEDIVDGQITNLPAAVNGDVYNIALPADVPNAKIGDQVITNGDNIVFVESKIEGEEGSWDKLAGAVDTTTFAEKSWVNDGTESGSLPMQMISGAYSTSAAMDAGDDDALVANAGVKDYVQGYIDVNTIKTATELSGIDETTSGKLVNAGAITGYVYDQIQTTIQETIDIATVLTSGMTGEDIKPASAVPNASAVTGYIQSITLMNGAAMTAKDVNPEALVSNSAVKEYVAEQLAGTNAYGGIIVNGMSASAAKPGDTFKMIDGAGVAIVSAEDTDGNPTIKFNSNIDFTGVAGTTSASAALTVSSDTDASGKITYDITVPDATTDTVGVVKADYYDEGTGLIHLF